MGPERLGRARTVESIPAATASGRSPWASAALVRYPPRAIGMAAGAAVCLPGAAQARRILRRLEFHFTPKHASWLNMVEIEIGVLRGQCLDRKISSRDILEAEIAAWERQRNDSAARIKWMFTTEKARHKLSRAYPKPHLPIEDQLKES